MYNRYQGNSGRVIKVEEPDEQIKRGNESSPAPVNAKTSAPVFSKTEKRPKSILGKFGLESGFGGLLKKLDPSHFEFEDILLLLVLYLLYRESGDQELLIMLGAMLLL